MTLKVSVIQIFYKNTFFWIIIIMRSMSGLESELNCQELLEKKDSNIVNAKQMKRMLNRI